MPKIKVYKGRGAIIPVETAKVSTAFVCPWTDKLFGNKASYVKHLKDLRESRIHASIKRKRHDALIADFNAQKTFGDIIRWVELHPEVFYDTAVRHSFGTRRLPAREDFWIKITYLDVHWDNLVSNSHNCPRGGTTNWGSRETFKDGTPKPRGYPGWHGRIEFQLSHDVGFGSDVFKGMGIHTGTGGGISNNRYGYDVKFFAEDWEGLKAGATWSILQEGRPAGHKSGDPIYFKH